MKVKKRCDRCGIMRNELYRRGRQMICGKCTNCAGNLSSYEQTIKHHKTRNDKRKGDYILIFNPEHPQSNSKGYVAEHRLVVEEKLGRYLKSKEVVHHIDKNPKNNDIDNLMLFESNAKHQSFHRKIQQFGITNPIRRQIEQRWDNGK